MKDIVIYGAGGFGREVACLIQTINKVNTEWNFIGFIDDEQESGTCCEYGQVLGGLQYLNTYDRKLAVVIAIGSSAALQDLSTRIVNPKIYFPNMIAPGVIFHDENSVLLGKGNIILFHSIISCNVRLGNFNLLNNDVMVGHDSEIGDFNVLNPSTRISGNVRIGDMNFFGVCSVILQKLIIGNNTRIAANSCVMRNTKDKGLYIGTPAQLRVTPEI